MKFRYILLFLFSLCCASIQAQNSKRVRDLKKQKTELQKTLQTSRNKLDKTSKDVKTGQRQINFLDMQIESRVKHIHALEEELAALERELTTLQRQIRKTESELKVQRDKLRQALRFMRLQRQHVSPAIFVLSAHNVSQMYRRARNAKRYALYEHKLVEEVLDKQAQLLEQQNRLLQAKSKKNDLMSEIMKQRSLLAQQQIQEKRRVDGLKKQESGLRNQVAQQQKQLNALEKKIDEVIAYEIEQARKKAEEEARRKAAQEKALAQKGKNGKSSGSSTTKGSSGKGSSWLTAEDRKLNGTFEQNKGRLPVPITGQYMVGNRFGLYSVPGLKNVKLDNKGINYIGRQGARARAVFNGTVSQVFQFGGMNNILIRHGSYISVYCNLSSVIVTKGQSVSTGDIIGTVANDGNGQYILHFQLRKETAKLNPEQWVK